jgi:hypothetical protein
MTCGQPLTISLWDSDTVQRIEFKSGQPQFKRSHISLCFYEQPQTFWARHQLRPWRKLDLEVVGPAASAVRVRRVGHASWDVWSSERGGDVEVYILDPKTGYREFVPIIGTDAREQK